MPHDLLHAHPFYDDRPSSARRCPTFPLQTSTLRSEINSGEHISAGRKILLFLLYLNAGPHSDNPVI